MMSRPIFLAVEDDLSEWVLRRILSERPVPYVVRAVFKKRGFGYLKKNAMAWNQLAKNCPVLLLTDLDTRSCAQQLLDDWLNHSRHPNFLFRVAVREVEAWILASDKEFGKFLGIRKVLDFSDPETIPDPKIQLLKLAEKSPRRALRESIVRRDARGILRQGPAYNSTLADFVCEHWKLAVARSKCSSLSRLLIALSKLEKKR